ncbi:MAG: hypothetical protein ACRD2I_21445, partial [Vicinamibacterales bacterium]
MYWLDDWEQQLDSQACGEAVIRVNRHLAEMLPTPADTLQYPEPHGSLDRVESRAQLAVTRCSRHRLRFYPNGDIWLYRFECRSESVAADASRRSMYLFAVARAGGHAGDLEDITILDWTSPPIHRLNEKLGLNLSRLDDALVSDYLVFFTSFIAGEESQSHPDRVRLFVLASDSQDLGWRSDLPERIEAAAHRERLQMFSPPAEADEADPPDFPARADGPAQLSIDDGVATAVHGQPITTARQRAAVSVAFHELSKNPEVVTTEAAPATDTSASELRLRFNALVLYGTALFRARFSVYLRGKVVMDEDAAIVDAGDLPVQLWEVATLRFGLRVLRQAPIRASWTSADVSTRLRPPAGALPARTATHASKLAARAIDEIVFRRGRVKGDLICASMSHSHRIVFEDVEFIGHATFDDCVFDHSLEFRGCRFLQSLSLKNTTVKGSLVMTECHIDGAVAEGSDRSGTDLEPALRCDGLTVERGILAERLTVIGQIRGDSMRVIGGFQMRGLRAWRRGFVARPSDTRRALRGGRSVVDATQLNFSRSNIQGALDLSSITDSGFRPGLSVRTHLGGDVFLTGVTADAVLLAGATFHGGVNLDWLDCHGTVDLSLTWPVHWRSRIGGDLSVDRAKVNLLQLNGCYVGGNLTMIELVVSSSIFAELHSGFRCRVEGELTISGASVSGGIEIEGIRVAGELRMITGKCTRLRAGCGIWSNHGKAQFVPADVGGIVLDSVVVTAGVSL